MRLKKKIYKQLGVFGFKKSGNCYVKSVKDNFYMVFRVEKIFDYDMLNEPEALGREYHKKDDCPHFYDILFDVYKKDGCEDSSVPYYDPECSLQRSTGVSKRNWTKWNEECEDEIVEDIFLTFKEYCNDGFLAKKKEEMSVYNFVIQSYKNSVPYPWFFQILKFAEMAYCEDKIKETWFWYEKAVSDYYECYIYHRYEKDTPLMAGVYDLFDSETFDVESAKKVSSEQLEEIKFSGIMPEREIGYFLDFRKILEEDEDEEHRGRLA